MAGSPVKTVYLIFKYHNSGAAHIYEKDYIKLCVS